MEAPITDGEIREVITTLKSNRSPGSDGLSNDIFKKFVNIVSPLLLWAYDHAFK